jgi:hypothetical protein
MSLYDTSDLAKAKVLLDATKYAIATSKKRYQFSEFCAKHNFPTFATEGRLNQEYKNLNGEWHILLRRYNDKEALCRYLEGLIQSLTVVERKAENRENGEENRGGDDHKEEGEMLILQIPNESLPSPEPKYNINIVHIGTTLLCIAGYFIIRSSTYI